MNLIDQLEQAAKAATQDKREYGSTKCGCGDPVCTKYHLRMAGSNGGIEENDAIYISLANPDTILKLIAVVRAAEMATLTFGASHALDELQGALKELK